MGCNFFESAIFMLHQAVHMPIRALMLTAVCLIVIGVCWIIFRKPPPHHTPDAK